MSRTKAISANPRLAANAVPYAPRRLENSLARSSNAGLFQPLPPLVWIISVLVAAWGVSTQYPLLIPACTFALPVLASLLIFRGESPILFLCCALQWLQATVAVFYCGIHDITLDQALDFHNVENATWYSLGGVMFIAIGIRTTLSPRGRGLWTAVAMENEAAALNAPRLFQFWLASAFISFFASSLGYIITALHQFIAPLGLLKWVALFMLGYQVLLTGKGWSYLLIAAAFHFLSGFIGYFSSFKEVLFMLLIVGFTLRRAFNVKLKLFLVAVAFLGLGSSIFWQAFKTEYRQWVGIERGYGQRGDFRPLSERAEWMYDHALNMSDAEFDAGLLKLVGRVSYVGFFGTTLAHVPAHEPHSNGELWLGAVQHVLMPRFLFPNKRHLDDSARARRFTGLRLAGAEEGTSIGIGYMAESYADFGRYGMFVPVYIIGLIMGWIYQIAVSNRYSTLLGSAIATAMLFSQIHMFETSNVKIFGSLISISGIFWILTRTFSQSLVRWLRQS
jgi:hypothetical protein